jgi:hypothetical protein
MNDLHPGVLEAGREFLRAAAGGEDNADLLRNQDPGHLLGMLEEDGQVHTPGPLRAGLAHFAEMLPEQFRGHGAGADEAQGSRLGGCRRQPPAADPDHARLDDGKLDAEQFRDARPEHG